ncbi:hypothetical protein E4U55_000424 [Claviceps digitariae]|nr:hypothetical protein E4U55_000424 [Claviceps digitariae]
MMSELPMAQTPPQAKKAKKLPFKPTALRKSSTPSVDAAVVDTSIIDDKINYGDGLDLFRRSKEMQPIMEADRQRRLLKKQKQEEERRKAAATAGKRPWDEADDNDDEASNLAAQVTPSATQSTNEALRSTTPINIDLDSFGKEASDLVTPPASKRTRLSSSPVKHINLTSADPASVACTSSFMSQVTSVVSLESPRSQRASQRARAKFSSLTPVPIVLSDSDDDDHAPTPTPRRIVDDDDVMIMGSSFGDGNEDEEFADYVRKAEEQRQSEANQKSDAAKESIHILVTSSVVDSKTCQMKVLYNRPLRMVRDTWLAMQKQKGLLVDIEDKDEIVLTWRRKKVYASSTLLHLGIRPEGNGRAVVDGPSTRGLGDNRTHVHMEVWTKAQFEQMECEEEYQRKREAGELSDDDDGPGQTASDEAPAVEVKLRVILKARGLDDVKLTVRPETTIETLITGFRTQQPSASGKDVGIWFDGDRLEEHMTMDEVEIDDLDTLEVHIK